MALFKGGFRSQMVRRDHQRGKDHLGWKDIKMQIVRKTPKQAKGWVHIMLSFRWSRIEKAINLPENGRCTNNLFSRRRNRLHILADRERGFSPWRNFLSFLPQLWANREPQNFWRQAFDNPRLGIWYFYGAPWAVTKITWWR